MSAQPLAVLRVEDHLHEPVAGTRSRCLAGSGEREFTDQDFVSCFPCRLFGHPDRCDLRMRIGAPGDVVVVERLGMLSGDLLDADDPLVRGDVRQGRTLHNVADGVVPIHIGPVKVIHQHLAAFGGNAGLLQPDAFEVGSHAHGRQDHVASDHLVAFLRLHGHLTAFARRVDRFDRYAGQHLHASFFERTLQRLGHLFILDGDDIRQDLDQGDLGADRLVKPGEFRSDGPGTHHHHGFRLDRQGHGFAVPDDLLAILRQVGQLARTGARGEDDVRGRVFGLRPVVGGHFDHLSGFHLAEAP